MEAANEILYEAKERERRALHSWGMERIWREILRWTVGYGVGLKALRAVGWMAGFALFGWLFGWWTTRRRSLSPWTLLWHSVSYTVPGFRVVGEDALSMPRCARNWFYVQRLVCFVFALFATAAAVGVIQP